MITIYCDEDIDVLVKPLLEAKGFQVRTTLDEKMLGASDRQQIDHAIKKGYLFLTHNRVHYERIYAELVAEAKDHHGIIIAARKNVYELARRISRVVSQFTKESIKNHMLYL